MHRVRMVPLVRVGDAFHARVIAARLGSEGILTQLRGGIDTPYPIGDVEVLVAEDDLEVAREILLADEVESSFEGGGDDEPARTRLAPWALALVLACLLVFAYVHTIGYQR